MDVGEGMVAMVRGSRDASLAVTLLDGARQYTLVQNTGQFSNPGHVQIVRNQGHTQESVGTDPHNNTGRCEAPSRCETNARCESSSQATDGRYTSMYKMTHCRLSPTSPPVELTEFPPQRAEVCPGHGNFEVGGAGSGDTYTAVRSTNNYRGGMSWTDRGSVCGPRPSHEPDTFANSLRKYPCLSPERSSEMVERLICYTQAKNASKNNTRSQTSPSRILEENSNYNMDRISRAHPNRMHKNYEHDTGYRMKKDESPTRDGRHKKCDYDCAEFRKAVLKNYDLRYLREVSRRARDSTRKMPAQNTNSVNMEIQAVVEMTSKEVATVPRTDHSKQNVAVPLPLATSTHKRNNEGEEPSANCPTRIYKHAQTAVNRINLSLDQFKSVQTSSSSIQLSNPKEKCQCSYHNRKTKSEEKLRNHDRVEKLSRVNSGPFIFSPTEKIFFESKKNVNFRDLKPPLCEECFNCKRSRVFNLVNCYRAEISPLRIKNDNLDATINDWFKDIPIKNKDFLGRHINLEHVARIVANRLRQIVKNANDENTLKFDIIKLIEEIPIDISDVNKKTYVNRLADEFLQRSIEFFELNSYKRKKYRTCQDRFIESNRNPYKFRFNRYIQPTDKEVRGFIKGVLLEFLNKYNSNICSKRLEEVEMELIDVLIDSRENLHVGNDGLVKEDLFTILREAGVISDFQAMSLTNALLERFKSFINIQDYRMDKFGLLSQTYIVLQNSTQNSSRKTNISIEPLSQRDIDACAEHYINQLNQEIDSWMSRVLGPEINDIKEVAVSELAEDIVDRLKYIERNPSKHGTDEEELEVMRFQIFKWIHKLVSDDTVQQTIEHAPELMTRLRSIPTPMFYKPGEQDQSITLPPCCVPDSNPMATETQPESSFFEQSQIQSTSKSFPLSPKAYPSGHNGSSVERRLSENKYSRSSVSVIEPTVIDASNTNSIEISACGAAGKSGCIRDSIQEHVMTKRRQSLPGGYNLQTQSRGFGNRTTSQIPLPRPTSIDNRTRRLSGPAAFDLETRSRVQHQPACCQIPGISSREITSSEINQIDQSLETIKVIFDEFLKKFIQELPVPIATNEEKNMANIIRRGFHNGVWKAILKVNLDPAKHTDHIRCQSILDEDIQELLDLLPDTEEIVAKKGVWKTNLLQKTVDYISMFLKKSKVSNYKQQLLNKVSNHITDRVKRSSDLSSNRYEELQKMQLVDAFILYTNFKEDDETRSSIYKNKMSDRVEEIFKNIKQTNHAALANTYLGVFKNEMINVLNKVPLPSFDVIKEETDEILLGIDIEKWFSDLPLTPTNDPGELLNRKCIQNAIAKQIHNIGKQIDLADDLSINPMKIVVMRFLQKLHFPPNLGANLHFMAEEFANRLKNRAREQSENAIQHSFEIPEFYEDFSNNANLHSSVIQEDSFIDRSRTENQQIFDSRCQIGAPVQIADGYDSSQQKEFMSLFEVTPENLELMIPPGQHSIQSGQASMLPQYQGQQIIPPIQSCCHGPVAHPLLPSRPGFNASQVQLASATPTIQKCNRVAFNVPETLQPSSQGNVGTLETSQIARTSGCPSTPRVTSGIAPKLAEVPVCCRNANQQTPAQSLAHLTQMPKSGTSISTMPSTRGVDVGSQVPVTYSTPEQGQLPRNVPLKMRNRRVRDQGTMRDVPRRQIDFSEDTETDEVQCRCMERVYRCRRRRPQYFDSDDDMECLRYFPMRYPCPFFF